MEVKDGREGVVTRLFNEVKISLKTFCYSNDHAGTIYTYLAPNIFLSGWHKLALCRVGLLDMEKIYLRGDLGEQRLLQGIGKWLEKRNSSYKVKLLLKFQTSMRALQASRAWICLC